MFSILSLHRKEPDLAVDFGTAILRAGIADGQRFSEEPSRAGTRPALRQGVIADADAAAAVLDRVFARYRKSNRRDLHVLACAPSDATEDEQALLSRALQTAGATRTAVVPEPVAALIGAGVDIGSDGAFMVIDLGEGVVDCALIKERRLFASATWRGGCAALREAVATCLRETHGLQVSDAEAEAVLRRVGVESRPGAYLPIHGTHEDTAVPAAVLNAALREKTDRIAATLLDFVKQLEPEICAEVIANGVEITGGGVLIPGLAEYCARVTHLPLRRAPRPLESVIQGACSLLGPAAKLNLWDSLRSFWPPGAPSL
ncbi:MAG: rod shape-determining protein [Chthoniobacteraceae bacterium]|nr:rod shape-determining protein [Chthoniobacteraceae bacterium]